MIHHGHHHCEIISSHGQYMMPHYVLQAVLLGGGVIFAVLVIGFLIILDRARLTNIVTARETLAFSTQKICSTIVFDMHPNFKRLIKEDFDKPCEELGLYLLGKILVRRLDTEVLLKGKIVEIECYLGGEDKGSHSFNGRRSTANEAMYMLPGTSYVYMTYGMYYCFNISSREPGAAVLIRALEPISGTDTMEKFRAKKVKSEKRIIKTSKLCDGPSKLCIAMNITKEDFNKVDLTDPQNDRMWLEDDPEICNEEIKVIRTSRIGIAYAGMEWANKPLRLYILNNNSISKRDKKIEKELEF